MLARSLVSLLPDLPENIALEVSCIHSAAGLPARVETRRPPFRSPHCPVTIAGLAGGGVIPRPGEMSLSHAGVLFLDELPHFRREVADLLRAPLEEGRLVLSRAGRSVELPARFQLVAAMNPCPCGFAGELHAACSCSPIVVQRYRARIPGPVLDRLDLSVRVPFVPAELRRPSSDSFRLNSVRERILEMRALQLERNGGVLNGSLPPLDSRPSFASHREPRIGWTVASIDSDCRCVLTTASCAWQRPWPIWTGESRSRSATSAGPSLYGNRNRLDPLVARPGLLRPDEARLRGSERLRTNTGCTNSHGSASLHIRCFASCTLRAQMSWAKT